MADPAWGSTSDEETARALCAFQHTDPLPAKRSEVPQLSPARGLAAFGYPTHGSFHLSVRRDEAAAVLVGMHAPSTVGDDWKRSQQRSIQEQIEQQQRELQVQTQQQQQRVMEAQLHHMQAQIQHQQEMQIRQEQTQRQPERIQQQRYSPGGAGFDQMRWAAGRSSSSRTGLAATPSCGGGGNAGQGSMHQPGRFYDGGFLPSQQIKSTTIPTPAPSYASSCRAAGVPVSADDGRFQPRQIQQSTQARLFATSAPQPWGRQEGSSTSLSGSQAERTRQFQMQMQTTQRVIPQQSRQPQPYYPNGATARRTSTFAPVDAVLNGLTRHFSNTAGPAAGTPANRAPGVADPGYTGASGNNLRYNPAQAQMPAKVAMHVPTDTQARPGVPPSGIPVVPGVALAPPLRLVTMRDILNSDDGSAKTNTSRGRPRGGKKQRAPPKRAAPKKKRQRMQQQQGERGFQRPPSRIGNSLPIPSTSLAPNGSSPPTPMYLAFMESRAARALQQTAGIARVGPPIAPTPSSQSRVLTPAAQLSTNGASQNQEQAGGAIAVKPPPVKRKRGPYKKKKVDAPQNTRALTGVQYPPGKPHAGASLDKQTSGPVQWMRTESVQSAYARITALNGLPHSVGGSDFSMAGDCAQGQPAQLPAPQPSLTLEPSPNGKAGTTPKKRRKAKLARAGSAFPAMLQQVATALCAPPPLTGSSATSTAVSTVVAQALAGVSDPPPVANRTVVIFCKRDFMRYQAAKIWRKYQDQLKKQGEWREVRVAGKRTRYLNSRYDEEMRRSHRKTYTRSGKPRKTATQPCERIRGDTQAASTANPVPMESTPASSVLLLTQGHERSSPARKPREEAESGISTCGRSPTCSGRHSSDEKLRVADKAGPSALQEQAPQTEGESDRLVVRSVSSEPSEETVSVEAEATTHPEPSTEVPDGNGAGNASNGSVTTDAAADGEGGDLVPKSNCAVPDEAPERGDVAIISESSRESAEVIEEVETEAADGDRLTSGASTNASGTHSSEEKRLVADKADPAALQEESLRTEEERSRSVLQRVSSEPREETVSIEAEATTHPEPSTEVSDGIGATGADNASKGGVTADAVAGGESGDVGEVPEGTSAVPDEAPERGVPAIARAPSHGNAEGNGSEIEDSADTRNEGCNVAVIAASCRDGVKEISALAPGTPLESAAAVAEEHPRSDTNWFPGETEPKSSPAAAPEQSVPVPSAKEEQPGSNSGASPSD